MYSRPYRQMCWEDLETGTPKFLRNSQVPKPRVTEDLRLALPGHACVEAGVS